MKLHDSHLSRLADPALRNYIVAVAASLAVIFTVKFDDGMVAAAGVPVLCGIAGLLLRWTAMPIALVLTLGYFLMFPIGSPLGSLQRTSLASSHFRLEDLLLAAAVVVYSAAQFRIFDLTQPAQHGTQRADTSRTVTAVDDNELVRLLFAVVVVTVIGQIMWWMLTNVEIHFGRDALLRWVPRIGMRPSRFASPSTQSAELGRLLLLVLIVVAVVTLARFTFWYLWLNGLQPLEAQLLLLDVRWRENRRELARVETWRSHALGHDRSRRGNPNETFRWVARSLFLAVFAAFLVWYLYFYLDYP